MIDMNTLRKIHLYLIKYYSLPIFEGFRLFLEAVLSACRIREIALVAYHSGVLIRWFDYIGRSEGTAKGGNKFLVPVNAREVDRIRRPRRSALEYLALTTSNRESLVFFSPSLGDDVAVLFTADSDLSFRQRIRWDHKMLITAPHHGSEENKYAYERFRQDTCSRISDVVWVRSDGKFKERPGPSYLSGPGTRYCTICCGCDSPKQNVRLVFRQGIWQPVSTRKCCCK